MAMTPKPFEELPICKKCASDRTDFEYQGQRFEVTDGTGKFLRFRGDDVIQVTCSVCGFMWLMEPADKSDEDEAEPQQESDEGNPVVLEGQKQPIDKPDPTQFGRAMWAGPQSTDTR